MPKKCSRNPLLDIAKLLSAFVVVFAHYPFPGRMGKVTLAMTWMGIQLFFGISGWFSFGAGRDTIARRLKGIVKLICLSSLIYMGVNLYFGLRGGNPLSELLCWVSIVPDGSAIVKWAITSINPFSEHLWYLTAIAQCYLILWIYLGFFDPEKVDYRPAYFGGFVLWAIWITLGCLLPYMGALNSFPAYRSGWIYGPATFACGLFLRQYQQTILRSMKLNPRKLLLIFLGFTLFAMVECLNDSPCNPLLGSVFSVPALLLLCTCDYGEKLPWHPILNRVGSLYTGIYILHIAVIRFYTEFIHLHIAPILGAYEAKLSPILVLALSIAAGIVWERIEWLCGPRKK